MTQGLAGPGTGMYLGCMGAEVVKIEPPRGNRDRGPRGTDNGFLVLNRGKRSLALDIRTEAGHEVIERLVRRSDVMLIAWEPGMPERLGYSYEAMRQVNPRLVYASITGWGTRGPLAMLRGYDRLMQAYTGVMASRPAPDGTPLESSFFVADMSIPMALSYGIMLALWSRERTGFGQKVETSQLEAMIAMQAIYLVYPEHGDDPSSHGSSEWRPGQTYRTQDGRYVVLVPLTDDEWAGLWRSVELPDFQDDPRLQTAEGRKAEQEMIYAALSERFARRPLAAWQELLGEARVPFFPVMTRDQFIVHPHAWENEMLVEVDQPGSGRTKMMGLPIRLSANPAEFSSTSAEHGQHTAEILTELGYSEAEIAALREKGWAK
jgi:crotonobetainyl-CoA:carnitine CoA-transferase CaiB-like acyl-CoA transferase